MQQRKVVKAKLIALRWVGKGHSLGSFTPDIESQQEVVRTARKRRTEHRPTASANGTASSRLLDQGVQQRIQYVAALLWSWRSVR